MNYNTVAPPDTFLGMYMHACQDRETPAKYDFWSAVWALGSVLGRSVYVDRPHAPVYMNWYVLFASESGVTRKSTAIRSARDVVSDVDGAHTLLEGKATPEYLFDWLASMPHTAIAVSELATFLGRESYVIEMPAFLTDLYDCPKERKGGTVTRGERVIENAYVTFLSASTPSWLRGAVNPTVVAGGFTSRCMFLRAEMPKKKIAWPTEDAFNTTRLAKVLGAIAANAQAVGTIELMPNALKRFKSWYNTRDITSTEPFIASFNSREDAHVLRMAATLAINDGILAINNAHIATAVRLIKDAKQDAASIFLGTGLTSDVATGIEKMINILQEAGGLGITHYELMKKVKRYISSDEMTMIISIMQSQDMITVLKEKKDAGRWPTRYVRSDGLNSKNKLADLLATCA